MDGPTLELIIEKGPREGETLVRKPGSVVRIGRLVKGNTFPIKDSGISSQHMLIECKAAKWVVSDLESSNGTLLNKVKLQALLTYDLRDGDMIKIGEYTSIKVKIVEEPKVDEGCKIAGSGASVEEVDGLGDRQNQVRRNPRRRARSKTVYNVEPIESDLALEECGEAKILPPLPKGRGRGRPRGRGRGAAASEIGALKDGELLESSEVQGIPGSSNLGPEISREHENVVTVGENRTGRAASKNKPAGSVSEFHKITDTSNLGRESCREADDVASVIQEKPSPVVARRRTRSSKKDGEYSVSVTGLPKIPESSSLGMESCKEPGNKVIVEEKRGGRVALGRNTVSEDEILAPVSVLASAAQLGGLNSEKDTCKESSRGPENVVAVEKNQTQQGGQKRMRASKNESEDETLAPVSVLVSDAQLGGLNSEKYTCKKSSRGPENVAAVEKNQTQRGAQKMMRASKNEPAATLRTRPSKDDDEPSDSVSVSVVPDSSERPNLSQEDCRELGNEVQVQDQAGKVALEGVKESEAVVQLGGSNSQKDASKELVNSSAIKENHAKVDYGKKLEKMTLGEWFDYMEIYLPKQIYDPSDKIILGMKERARKLNEYMSQQQNGKAKLPAV
ncbi:hypothetical protein NE237_033031 [Protea cynaroides]|uniref:FHA domain-containing protein n=1 Tax=Protea cynaroides TaxID=273540 RepID=A0A9Q0L5L8_9MAGN|nr:hypothetical protein NE237_033031 [Protea cynaroides]